MALIIKIDHWQDPIKLPVMDYRSMVTTQGDLKDLVKKNYDRLRKSLKEDGLLSPFYLWRNPVDNLIYIVDGHQRQRVMMMEKAEPFEMPYLLIPAENLSEAKRKLLQISSQYGSITQKGYENFKINLDLPADWLMETINFDALYQEFNPTFEDEKTRKPLDLSDKITSQFKIEVTLDTEADQQALYEDLHKKGLKVKILNL